MILDRIKLLILIILIIFSVSFVGCGFFRSTRLEFAGNIPNKKQKRNISKKIHINGKSTENGAVIITYKLENFENDNIRTINIYRSAVDLSRIKLNSPIYPISKCRVNLNPLQSLLSKRNEDSSPPSLKKSGNSKTPEKNKDIVTNDAPIAQVSLKPGELNTSFKDETAAHNTKYYYLLEITDKDGKLHYSETISVQIPQKALPALKNPTLHFDKTAYILNVLDGGRPVKRYPICQGSDPVKRKLHQDNSTTPEGIYKIVNLQPKATYYKAYDINYPNKIDKARYQFAADERLLPKRNPSIGGEIQVHGGFDEITTNWTAGCMSLRNADIDELFECGEIAVGTRVIITGSELTIEDLESIKKRRSLKEKKTIQKRLKKAGFNPGPIDGVFGGKTMTSLGRFQKKNKLPMTLQLDRRTVEELEKIELREER